MAMKKKPTLSAIVLLLASWFVLDAVEAIIFLWGSLAPYRTIRFSLGWGDNGSPQISAIMDSWRPPRLLHHQGQQQASARARLLRGRARAASGGEATQQRWGAQDRHELREVARATEVATVLAIKPQAVRQPAGFRQLLNQGGSSVRRNRPYVQTGIRTLRKTIRSEHSAQTDAQTILAQR
jgi:hypothetical protein